MLGFFTQASLVGNQRLAMAHINQTVGGPSSRTILVAEHGQISTQLSKLK
jgi:hypothetical protein